MSVKEFYSKQVGRNYVIISDMKNNTLWEGIETIKNEIPEMIQYTDIIKWQVKDNKFIIWIDEENI